MPAIFVARDDAVPDALECRRQGRFDHHQQMCGQIVEQRGRVFIEQGQIKLDARCGASFADGAIQVGAAGFTFKARAVTAAEVLQRLVIQRHFAGRQQLEAVDLLQRSLRFGIEVTDAFDLVIKQVDA